MSKNPNLFFNNSQEMLTFAMTLTGLQKINSSSPYIQGVAQSVFISNSGRGFHKHGLSIALKSNFNFKETSQFSTNFWVERGWGLEESKEKVLGLQKKNASKMKAIAKTGAYRGFRSKSYFVEKYGEKKGTHLYLEKNHRSSVTLENFIRRHGLEKGTAAWEKYLSKRKRQISLEGFIDRYGDEGPKKWDEYCKARKFCVSLSYFVEKHGEEKGREIWENRNRAIGIKNAINKTLPFRAYSNEANTLFRQVCERGGIPGAFYGDREQILFLNKEDAKLVGQNIIRPDFLYGNKIIEYNGSKWHANPMQYQEQDTPNPFREGKTSREIWERDAARINSLENLGYKVLVIWDTEYKNNAEGVVQRCLSFLKEKQV